MIGRSIVVRFGVLDDVVGADVCAELSVCSPLATAFAVAGLKTKSTLSLRGASIGVARSGEVAFLLRFITERTRSNALAKLPLLSAVFIFA